MKHLNFDKNSIFANINFTSRDMNNIKIEKSDDTALIKFSETDTSIMERIAVFDYDELRTLISNIPIVRCALYCFFIIESGDAEIEINGICKKVGRNELVCALPGDVCIWKAEDNLKGKFILFEGPFLTAVLTGGFTLEPISYLNSTYHYPFIELSERRHRKLLELTYEMTESLEECPVFYDMLRVQLWQFVFLTEKEYIANQNREGRQSNSPNHISNFINHVNKHFRTAHDAKFYADKMNISPNYLNKIIKKSLGVTPYDYILNHILSEAKILLRLTDISIKELAHQLGFEDANYFIRCFKKVEGITPREYRNRGSL